MLQFVLGTAGSGKTWYVRNLIAGKVAAGEKGILLLVPEQNNYESERAMLRLLGSASTDIVEVTSFTLLARNIAAICGTDALRVADDGVKLLMMGRAIRSVSPQLQVFGKVGATRELCEKMLEFYTEIKRSSVTSEDLSAVTDKLNGAVGNKLGDIAMIFSTYEGMLANRFSDPLDDLVKLGENLNSVNYFSDRTVVIDAFKGFTEQQYRVIYHIIRQAKEVYVTVCADSLADTTDGTGVFSNNKATAAHLLKMAHSLRVEVNAPITVDSDRRFNNTVLRSVEQVMRGCRASDTVGGELTVCACANTYDEADYIARTIRKLVRTEGYRYRDFTVVARDMTEYRNLLCDAFERYGVACFSDMRTDAASLALFRYVLNVLHCAVFGLNSDLIMQCVKSVVSGFSVEDAALLDNYVLMWNIKGSRWNDEWVQNPNGLDETFDYDTLSKINSLRKQATEPLLKLCECVNSSDVRTVCRGIYEMLISVGADRNLAKFADGFESRSEFYSADVHRQSWTALMSCLDNTVRVFDGESCDKREFYDMFEVLLSSCDIGSIPDKLDEVVIGSADRIRAGNPRITFVIGANFSKFPKPIGKGGLLSLPERRRVISAGIEIPDFEKYAAVDEQFYIYSALCTPSERLYITYHTSIASGDKCLPAEFVNKLRNAIPSIVNTTSSHTECDRFEGVLPSVELVSTEKFRPYADSVREQLLQRGIAAGAISFDGPKLDEASLTAKNSISLFGDSIYMSASKAEVYAHCPFSYFCQYGLSAKPVRVAELDVVKRGTLVHYVMENIVRSHGRGLADFTYEQRIANISAILRQYADTTLGGYDNLDKSFLFMLDRISLVLEKMISRYSDELKNSDYTADRFELKIGGDEIPPVEIPLDEGELILTGYVDRVDVFAADGKTYVRVVDYKTNSKTFDISDIFYGLNMQMLIYLFAIVSGDLYKDAVGAGILYMPSVRPIHSVDRRVNDEELEKMDDGKMRMNGLLLDDKVSLSAMEHNLGGKFIPYSASDGKSVIDSETFEQLEKEINRMLRKIGNSIHSGFIGVTPIDSVHDSACKYCDYKSVCMRDMTAPRASVKKLKLSDALNKLRGGDSDGI